MLSDAGQVCSLRICSVSSTSGTSGNSASLNDLTTWPLRPRAVSDSSPAQVHALAAALVDFPDSGAEPAHQRLVFLEHVVVGDLMVAVERGEPRRRAAVEHHPRGESAQALELHPHAGLCILVAGAEIAEQPRDVALADLGLARFSPWLLSLALSFHALPPKCRTAS